MNEENKDIETEKEQLKEEVKQELLDELREEEEQELWRCAKARLKGSVIFLVICIIIFFLAAVITAWSS